MDYDTAVRNRCVVHDIDFARLDIQLHLGEADHPRLESSLAAEIVSRGCHEALASQPRNGRLGPDVAVVVALLPAVASAQLNRPCRDSPQGHSLRRIGAAIDASVGRFIVLGPATEIPRGDLL